MTLKSSDPHNKTKITLLSFIVLYKQDDFVSVRGKVLHLIKSGRMFLEFFLVETQTRKDLKREKQ